MTRRLLALAILLAAPLAACRADYALRNGDTVVFLGDSITAARAYGKIVENYTLLRYPARKVRFVNSGRGGDTAAGGLARLEEDVFRHGATVLLVAYGINDIGWGVKADAEHRQKYLDAVTGIVAECRKRRVRVFICSAAVTAADPATSEESFLQKMCDEGMEIARTQGEGAIDVQRSMREIQKTVAAYNARLKDDKGKTSLHHSDGVHLSDLGQLAMAFAILKGLGAPADVSSVVIEAKGAQLVRAEGCKVTALQGGPEGLELTRLDEGRPLNFGLFGTLQFRFLPIPEQLNRYMLTVHNLSEGRYEIRADDRLLGVYSAKQCAAGLNLASATADAWQPGGPWDAEATILGRLTDARSELGLAKAFTGVYLQANPNRAALEDRAAKVNLELEALQHALVQPVPYRFSLRPADK